MLKNKRKSSKFESGDKLTLYEDSPVSSVKKER